MLILLTATGSLAEQVRYYRDGEIPNPSVVASILGHGRTVHHMKMRGAGDYDEPAAEATDAGEIYGDVLAREHKLAVSAQAAVESWQARVEPAAAVNSQITHTAEGTTHVNRRVQTRASASPAALAVTVNFSNNSAQLQSTALPSLDAIAEGMRMVGFARPFVIEGHTSASGSATHNRKLSRLRAESVKRYLVQHENIPAAALRTVGLGSSRPLDTQDPNAATNRRVQFRAA